MIARILFIGNCIHFKNSETQKYTGSLFSIIIGDNMYKAILQFSNQNALSLASFFTKNQLIQISYFDVKEKLSVTDENLLDVVSKSLIKSKYKLDFTINSNFDILNQNEFKTSIPNAKFTITNQINIEQIRNNNCVSFAILAIVDEINEIVRADYSNEKQKIFEFYIADSSRMRCRVTVWNSHVSI